MAKGKKSFDYRKITIMDMATYIAENHNDDETKEWFKSFNEMKGKKTYVNVLDAQGKPVQYVDKNGNTRIKKKAVAVKGGEQKPQFNMLKAKKGFYERYNGEIEFTNPPIKKDKKNVPNKVEEALALLK